MDHASADDGQASTSTVSYRLTRVENDTMKIFVAHKAVYNMVEFKSPGNEWPREQV